MLLVNNAGTIVTLLIGVTVDSRKEIISKNGDNGNF